MQKIDISGAIVTYNNEETIEKCILSILEDTKNLPFRLYVYDNGSTDNTVPIVRSFPEVILTESFENVGFGQGHNEILKMVDSDVHFVINPDIVIPGDRSVIPRLARFLDRNHDVGIVTPKICFEDGEEQFLPKRDPNIRFVILSKFPLFRKFRRIYTMADRRFESPKTIDSSTGCFFGIQTPVMKDVDGFDPRFFLYFEDADLSRRVRQQKKIVFYPGTYVYHGWKRENMHSLKGIRIFLTSMAKYLWKWRQAD